MKNAIIQNDFNSSDSDDSDCVEKKADPNLKQ